MIAGLDPSGSKGKDVRAPVHSVRASVLARRGISRALSGFSDLILQLYGPETGGHARSAVGMAGLPLGVPVEIEAEVQIRADREDHRAV
jgi:enamine deaminase RidA (YjgF/YER057c/UK114 family)